MERDNKYTTMKNIFKCAFLIFFITLAPALQSKDFVPVRVSDRTETLDAAEAQRLIERLEEIKAMDKTSITRSEKRALRLEVKNSQKKLNSGGGVYLSVGALIIIILLLIILL